MESVHLPDACTETPANPASRVAVCSERVMSGVTFSLSHDAVSDITAAASNTTDKADINNRESLNMLFGFETDFRFFKQQTEKIKGMPGTWVSL